MNITRIAAALITLFTCQMVTAEVPQIEREALVSLFQSTQGNQWTDNSNWLNGDPCDNAWYGVICFDGNIGEVRLSENNLVGSIPTEIGDFGGLTALSLSRNHLSGEVPEELGNLNGLVSLYLHENHLSGDISIIGNLTNLRSLYLHNNQLTGEIPEEVGQLSFLVVFAINGNRLSGKIPDSITNLGQLVFFIYDDNALYPGGGNTNLSEFLFTTSCFEVGFLNIECSQDFQTTSPSNFHVANSTEDSITLMWDEVNFDQEGGYHLWMSTTESGPFRMIHQSEDKQETSYVFDTMSADDEYYFQLKTFTNPYENNRNLVFSPAVDLTGNRSEDIQYPMQAIHSGAWYTPDQNGHGLSVQILPNNVGVVYWYVYDNQGNQMWLVGAGLYDGKSIQANMTDASGGLFPPEFNSDLVDVTFWGTVNLSFTDQDSLNLSWTPKRNTGFDPGQLSLQQLTRMVPEDDSQANDSNQVNATHSGSWFNPDQNGHGMVVEILPNDVALIYWYVFDEVGNQIWMLGSGTSSGTQINVEMNTLSGTMFPPNFESDDLISEYWGSASMTFDDCNNAIFAWQPDSSNTRFTAGQMQVQRLTSLAELTCSD